MEDFWPFFVQGVINLSKDIIDFDGLTTNTVEYFIVQYCHGCLKRYDIVTRPTAFLSSQFVFLKTMSMAEAPE